MRAVFFRFAQHERTLTGASPQTALIVGRLQPKARVSAVRRNLKEASAFGGMMDMPVVAATRFESDIGKRVAYI